jgi:hypothetical protein
MANGRKTGGRVKGTPNKATRETRSLISSFVDTNASRVQELWDRVAGEDPAKALEIYAKITEFALPKLARTEVSGDLAVRGKLIIDG